jgi:hypothetical protein
MLDWLITSVLLAAALGSAVHANHKAGQPFDETRPRRLPWRGILIASVFTALLAIVHMANLAGLETGPEHGLFGRR